MPFREDSINFIANQIWLILKSLFQNAELRPSKGFPSTEKTGNKETPPATVQKSYCKSDPDTGIDYSRAWSFRPSTALTERLMGGDGNTPVSKWVQSWTAPGPVYEVTAEPTGGWERVDHCEREGNVATCEGRINGGDSPINMHVKWVQLCPEQ